MAESPSRIDLWVLSALRLCGEGVNVDLIAHQANVENATASRSLQRLKRAGLVTNEGRFWTATDG